MKALESSDPLPHRRKLLPRQPRPACAIVAHKFGGSSLADATRIRHVAELLRARAEATQVVVVSAMQGVTDALIALTDAAAAKCRTGVRQWASAARSASATPRSELLGDNARRRRPGWTRTFRRTRRNAARDQRARQRRPRHRRCDQRPGRSLVRASAACATCARDGADYALLDAREVLVVRHEELGVAVDWDATAPLLADWRAAASRSRASIVTGYVARDADGRATVLGRNGSDYSGAIFAALWNAQELHIWTDVDGVLSADPRVEPEAVTLAAMTYEEACELAYFGAKVIHPQTMAPAIARGLPIFIRNTFKPEHPGTRIDADGDDQPARSRA